MVSRVMLLTRRSLSDEQSEVIASRIGEPRPPADMRNLRFGKHRFSSVRFHGGQRNVDVFRRQVDQLSVRLMGRLGKPRKVALKPIYGAARVAWGLLGLMRKVPPGATSHLALVNGQLGILTYLDGVPYAVLAFSLANDRIKEIALIVNPDTLHGIPISREIVSGL